LRRFVTRRTFAARTFQGHDLTPVKGVLFTCCKTKFRSASWSRSAGASGSVRPSSRRTGKMQKKIASVTEGLGWSSTVEDGSEDRKIARNVGGAPASCRPLRRLPAAQVLATRRRGPAAHAERRLGGWPGGVLAAGARPRSPPARGAGRRPASRRDAGVPGVQREGAPSNVARALRGVRGRTGAAALTNALTFPAHSANQ
jgi:hypothetical protein